MECQQFKAFNHNFYFNTSLSAMMCLENVKTQNNTVKQNLHKSNDIACIYSG